jgi:hypothetical protein
VGTVDEPFEQILPLRVRVKRPATARVTSHGDLYCLEDVSGHKGFMQTRQYLVLVPYLSRVEEVVEYVSH